MSISMVLICKLKLTKPITRSSTWRHQTPIFIETSSAYIAPYLLLDPHSPHRLSSFRSFSLFQSLPTTRCLSTRPRTHLGWPSILPRASFSWRDGFSHSTLHRQGQGKAQKETWPHRRYTSTAFLYSGACLRYCGSFQLGAYLSSCAAVLEMRSSGYRYACASARSVLMPVESCLRTRVRPKRATKRTSARGSSDLVRICSEPCNITPFPLIFQKSYLSRSTIPYHKSYIAHHLSSNLIMPLPMLLLLTCLLALLRYTSFALPATISDEHTRLPIYPAPDGHPCALHAVPRHPEFLPR